MWIPRIGVAVLFAGIACAQAGGPQITTNSIPNGSVGAFYTAQISSTLTGTQFGAPAWSIVGGSIPTGISLTVASGSAATLSGIPSVAGPYSFTILVTEPVDVGRFVSVEKSFTFSITGGIQPSSTALTFA